jgi:hypothetical protein
MIQSAASVSTDKAKMWTTISKVKDAIILKLQAGSMRSPSDGVRSQSIKFLETVVILYSDAIYSDGESIGGKRAIPSLEDIAADHALLDVDALRDEGSKVLDVLFLLLDEELSVSNYQVIAGVLNSVARQRLVHFDSILPQLLRLVQPPVHLSETAHKSLVHWTKHALRLFLRVRNEHVTRWHGVISDVLVGKMAISPDAVEWAPSHRTKREKPVMAPRQPVARYAVVRRQGGPAPPYVQTAQALTMQIGGGLFDFVTQNFANFPASATPADEVPPVTRNPLLQLLQVDTANASGFRDAVNLLSGQLLPYAERGPEDEAAEAAAAEKARIKKEKAAAIADPRMLRKRKRTEEAVEDTLTASSVVIKPMVHRAVSTVGPTEPKAKRKKPGPKKFAAIGKILLPTATRFHDLQQLAWERLLSLEGELGAQMMGEGAAQLRLGIIARICVQQPVDGELHKKVLDRITVDYAAHEELALTWLYQEFGEQNLKLASSTRYEEIMLKLLRKIGSNEEGAGTGYMPESAQRNVSELLKRCPKVTEDAIGLLNGWCADYSRVKVGLLLLRQLIVDRPATRRLCLKTLLQYTLHKEESIREPAIRIAVRLFKETFCFADITKFASLALDTLICVNVAPTNATAEMDEWGVSYLETDLGGPLDPEVLRSRGKLYLSLCTRDASLIHRLLPMWVQAEATVRGVLQSMSTPLWVTLGGDNPELLKLISYFPEEGLPYVLSMLADMKSNNRATAKLIEAVKSVHAERLHNVQLLVPFLHKHTRDEVVALLPKLIGLLPAKLPDVDAKAKRKLFRDALDGLFSAPECPLPPAELMV